MPASSSPVAGEARERLRTRLQALGFDEVRFTAATPAPSGALAPWLRAGRHADMDWMPRTAAKREDPSLVLDGARTLVMLGVNYWAGPEADERAAASGRPRWARYALHADYHDTIKIGLESAGRAIEELLGAAPDDYRYYVDTGPVLERGWAARAGLGFRGKNGMLVSRRHGNWLFLAAILLRAEVAPDEPLRPGRPRSGGTEPAGLLCGKCTRCLDACPTAAFPSPGVVDSRRCISYHTIESRGVIPRELRAGIGDRLYGCDTCLEVCPWNRFARAGRSLLLSARPALAELSLADVLNLNPARFAEVFRGTAVKRLKLAGLLRNACVVAGNVAAGAGPSHPLLPSLLRLAARDVSVVRAHAVWAVGRIAGAEAAELLADARPAEEDPIVLAEYAALPR